MPKLKPNNDESKNRLIQGYISKNMTLYGISEEYVAARVHFTKRTFQNKRKRPETFTVGELRKICLVLKFSDEEKAQVL